MLIVLIIGVIIWTINSTCIFGSLYKNVLSSNLFYKLYKILSIFYTVKQ